MRTAQVAFLEQPRRLIFKQEQLDPDSQGEGQLPCESLVTAISPGTELAAYLGAPPQASEIDGDEHDEGSQLTGGTRLALDRLVSALRGENAAQLDADKQAIIKSQRLLFARAQSHLAGGAAMNPQQLDPGLSITGRSGDRYA